MVERRGHPLEGQVPAAEPNEESFSNLRQNLEELGLDPRAVPIVFQYNKRDLPQVASIEEMGRAINFRDAPWREAVAIRGEGVLETLGCVLEEAVEEIIAKYPGLALGPGMSTGAWTWNGYS